MAKFQLVGIESPGRVDIFKMGVVELENLPENLQEKLYKDGCPYLQPTPEETLAMNPGAKKISQAPTPRSKRTRK
jgi:hypothetical protein